MADLNHSRSAAVGVWQGCSVPADLEKNLSQVSKVLLDAEARALSLVLFPELFVSGYDCRPDQLHDASLSQEALLLQVEPLVKSSGICLALPYIERDNDSSKQNVLYNSCALFDCSGRLVLNYRKVNLWGAWEQSYFHPGDADQLKCVDLNLGSGISIKVGILICFDIEFPEPARCLALLGAELLIVPTALGTGEVDHMTPMHVVPTRALENHIFILYSNFEGTAQNVKDQDVSSFCGRSAILGPDGLEIARAGAATKSSILLTATLNFDSYSKSIARNPYLTYRTERSQKGYYNMLQQKCSSLGVQRETNCISSQALPRDVAVAEKERLQHYIDGLSYQEFQYAKDSPAQNLRLYLPPKQQRWICSSDGWPLLFLVHGGFWKSKWSSDNTQTLSLVPDFLNRGFAVALVEYRRREMQGGKWPGPEEDVTAALQYLREVARFEPVDLARVVILGHSCGGQLALAACCRASLMSDAVTPCLCVSIAAVPDMLPGFEHRLSDEGDAIEQYMGFSPDCDEHRKQYRLASISSRLPLPVPTLLVTGSQDVDVPPKLVRDFYQKCCQSTQTGNVKFLEVYGADHYQLVTTGDRRWLQVAGFMTQILQETCCWSLPPHPADYDVTETRGFLPISDPLVDLCSLLPPSARPQDVALFAAWEKLVESLPSHLCASSIRAHILTQMPKAQVKGWQQMLLDSEPHAERAFLLLSWLGHAWVWGEADVAQALPSCIAVPWTEVACILGRPPILTYYSFNASNWRRFDSSEPINLGNICRINNFLVGQDEEWFGIVHVAIEASAGKAILAAVRAQQVVVSTSTHQRYVELAEEMLRVADAIEEMIGLLQRMKERCDPYIYYMRVRVFMKGWTADELPNGMQYEGVQAPESSAQEDSWRHETYFGESGAQSSVIPALDAVLGLAMTEDDLSPYLKAMRDYMPPKHSQFIRCLEHGPSIRAAVLRAVSENNVSKMAVVEAYNRCIQGLSTFRGVHFELAYSFVRKWDDRKDDEIKGTGGTPFMPYLKKHRGATKDLLIAIPLSFQGSDNLSSCPNQAGIQSCPS